MKELNERLSALSPAQRALLELRLRKKQPAPAAAPPGIPKRQEENYCPLSLDQERIWFIQQLDLDSPAYNIYTANRFTGRLDVRALTASLNEIARRHEIMRTTFEAVDGRPAQVIAPELRVSIPVVDLRALPAPAREPEAERITTALVSRPFDLTRLPLFRSVLVRVDEESHVCATVFHHIITDWVSFHIFERELALLYEAALTGRPSPLAPLPLQYADFAAWQRGWLEGEAVSAHAEFWRRQLEGAPLVLDLPRDHPRPAAQTPWGYRQPVTLSKAHSDAVRRLAQQEEVTLFIALLAVFKALLFRLTGQERLIVGSPIANRNRAETEELLGFFINQLVLCTDFSGDPTFRELLRRVREVALAAYAHQEMPFGKLVEELQPERDLSHTPLTQVVFLFLNPQQQGILKVAGLDISPYMIDGKSSKFDMTFALWDNDAGFEGWIEYNTDLFDKSTVIRMAEQFRTLLAAIVADPDRRLSELPVLSEYARHQLLVEWNDTADAAATDDGGPCVHQLFETWAALAPDATAVASAEERLSYGELNRRANRLAHRLRGLNVRAETRVGVLLERSPRAVVALLAVLKAGGAYVPLDPEEPPERVAFMLEDARAAALLTEGRLVERLPATSARVVLLDREGAQPEEPGGEGDENPAPPAAPENLAYVIYTSGSTGKPKGVAVEHRGLRNLVAWHRRAYDVRPGDRATLVAGQAFDASVWELWPYLAAGASVHIPDEETRTSPAALVGWLASEGITLSFLPTPLAEVALEERWPAAPALRCLLTGGDRLRRGPDADAPFLLFNHYGPTENTVVTTAARVGAAAARRDAPPPIGRPISNTQVYLLDAHMWPVPVGAAGELCVGGDGLARGYLGRAGLTAEAFVPNPFSAEPGARLYRTGDLARYSPDGQIEFLGRADHQVKLRGFRVEVGEVEAVLAQHEAVGEAVVLAREDVPGQRRLVAYVVPARESVAVAELREHLKEKLPEYMVPSAFVMLDVLPLTRNGKIDRRGLPPPDPDERAARRAYVAPRNAAERQLAEIWQQSLGVPRVGVHDNFFDLGGDSILSIQIIARANRAGLRLAPKQLFQHQTIAELAAASGAVAVAHAEQGAVEGRAPLTPIQHWFFEQGLPDAHYFNQSLLFELREGTEPQTLAEAFARVCAHHDALRLRFTREGETWRQAHADEGAVIRFTRFDLSELTGERRRAVADISAAVQSSLDLAAGPLARAALFEPGAGRSGSLLVVIHHLVVDGVSWRILLEDLHAAYEQLRLGERVELPPKTTSFKRWAERLTEYARAAQVDDEAAYWTADERAGVKGLPVDRARGDNTVASARAVEVSLDEEETRALLHEVPACYRAQINDVLLTALAYAFAAWTGERRLLVDLEGHGREELFDDVDLSRTVGWFTTISPVLIDLGGAAGPADAVSGVKEQLRQLPRRGLGYGLLRYLRRDATAERLRALPPPEVSFNYLGQLDLAAPGAALFVSARDADGPARSPRAPRRYLFEINGGVAGGRLSLAWTYSENLHERATVEWLARAYADALRAVIAHRASAGASRYAPSDFPLARLGRGELERLGANYREVEDIYPLSPIQQGMLFHTLAAPGAGAYVEQLSCELGGELDAHAFGRAWQRVIEHHPILRTSFPWGEFEQPVQVVHRRAAAGLNAQDWRGLTEDEQRERLEAFLVADRARGFDPASAPLMRLALFRTGERAHRFVWSHHHLLLDGWSVPLVLREVLEHYRALCGGGEPHVEPARPYRDYIAWLLRQDQAKAEAYWRRVLKGFAAPTPLGADHEPYDAAAAESWGDEVIRLSRAATGKLQSLARRHRLTLNTLVQGAWALFLSQHSGADDVLFGVTASGRPAEVEGVETMVGLFINTLPVRVLVPRGAAVVEWLERLQGEQVEMRDSEYSPLVQEWSEVPLGRPLFESLLVFENYPAEEFLNDGGAALEVGGLRVAVRTKYPITLVAMPGPELFLHIAYDRRRFEPQTIAAMLAHLRRLLEAIASDPRARVSALPTPPDAARPRLRGEWRTQTAPTAGVPDYVAPRTAVEEVLARVWADLLGREQVGVYDNFFDAGGHSLIAAQLISRVRDAFKIELSLRHLFEAGTVAGLAVRVEAALGGDTPPPAEPVRPATRDEDLPLSLAQEPLWFVERALPGNAFFNVPAALRLSGALNVALLERSLAEIVRRHESLRTTFAEVDGEPVQSIAPAGPPLLSLIDLRELSARAREEEARRLAAEEFKRPFDLGRGPLLRITLLRLADEEHRALVVLHHIIADDWSVGVFIRELAALYKAFSEGRPSPLAELPVQYADYAVWQRRWLRGETFKRQLAFWRKQLEGELEPLNLPTDNPRPARPTFRTALRTLRLPAELSDAVKRASRDEGMTLFTTLVGALQVLLHRRTGRRDIRVGTLVANRNRAETEGLIGLFINTLVIRATLSDELTYRQALSQVRETVLAAFNNQDLPFELLMQELERERELQRASLIEVLFILQNAPTQPLELKSLTLSPFEDAEASSEPEITLTTFDLVLMMWEGPDGLAGSLRYKTELFREATITRLLEDFQGILASIAFDPSGGIGAGGGS